MPISRRKFLVLGGVAVGGAAGLSYLAWPAVDEAGQVRPLTGTGLERLDGPAKVTGTARYAFEHPQQAPAYVYPVMSTIARGSVTAIDTGAAEAVAGVLAVLTHLNAPRLVDNDDLEMAVLQSADVHFRGQYVAAVVAESQEVARHAAGLVAVSYQELPHEVELPESGGNATVDVNVGDVDAAMASAAVTLDQTYTTPYQHHNPMETHTAVARWSDDGLQLHASSQGVHQVQRIMAPMFGLPPEQVHVASPHVGGGFGARSLPQAPMVLAVLAARSSGGRPVRYAVSRQHMFSVAGYRTPTRQRIRLAADADGRLTAISHDAVEQTARIKEFTEDSAAAATVLYGAPNRRVHNRLVPLDVPVNNWMRAPGKTPGVHAMEMAMDEMAEACGLDPIEFRIRNEPDVDPESGMPFSSRNLVGCLREGAQRFGWEPRGSLRRDGEWMVGTGVAAATHETNTIPGSVAQIRFEGGRYAVSIGATDLGTGAWTALAQIAAEALQVPFESVDPRIGDTAFPQASMAVGSTGTASWGSAIVEAARVFRETHGTNPGDGAEAQGTGRRNPDRERYSMNTFGAHFAEVRVHADTGEIRVPRMLGVFSVGRIINSRLARSQFLGGMTMGLSMALHEKGVLDPNTGHVVNHDFAEYHVASNADVGAMEAIWLEEQDPLVNPLGVKGIGETGIVGAAAAIASATYNATGIRVRDLPITPDKLLR